MNEIIFSLEPQDNARLQSLCGAFDEHLALIEKVLISLLLEQASTLRFNRKMTITILLPWFKIV